MVKYGPCPDGECTEKREPEIARIIGESYVQLNLYEEAIPYLEKYMETGSALSAGRINTVWPMLIIRQKHYDKAADLFGQITGSESALSQNALYHLADCQSKAE